MKSLMVFITFICLVLVDISLYGQSIGFAYKSVHINKTEQIFEMNSNNSFSVFGMYENIRVDLSYESLNFYENAHRTDSFNSVDRTFYGYNAKGNQNRLEFVSIGLGATLPFYKYFRYNAGITLGIAVSKEIGVRLKDESDAYLISFNDKGSENINSVRVRFYQSLTFEKHILKGINLILGYETNSALNTIVEIGNSAMPNSSMSDWFNTNVIIGIKYSFSK